MSTAPHTPAAAALPHQGPAAGTTPPRTVGLDLSISATGIAYWDGYTETIGAAKWGGDWRLVNIRKKVLHHVTTPRAALVVIEDLPTHAHGSGITGMVHGIVRELLLDHGIPYALVPPATLKKYATGRGNATKADMRMALYQRAGIDLRDDNQVDAWWLRAAGMDALGHPIVEVPKTHREALERVAWPEAVTPC
ncbi:hypothetical protein [Micrococcus luteus]|uniref:hypothetical protein n=1 Tax=Micrococcus luteus TaxID=1270 RepID=UPI00332104B5